MYPPDVGPYITPMVDTDQVPPGVDSEYIAESPRHNVVGPIIGAGPCPKEKKEMNKAKDDSIICFIKCALGISKLIKLNTNNKYFNIVSNTKLKKCF